MSKIIDSLKKMSEIKKDKLSATSEEASNRTIIAQAQKVPHQERQTPAIVQCPPTTLKRSKLITWILIIVLIMLMGFNLILFSMAKNNALLNSYAITKLNTIEQTLNKNNQQLGVFLGTVDKLSTELKQTNTQLKDSQETVNYLEKKVKSREVAIENLIKAKKSMYQMVAELYGELDKLKAAVAGKTTNKEIIAK